ncbi:hypothetical protein ACJX0J_011141 [Zea mays]
MLVEAIFFSNNSLFLPEYMFFFCLDRQVCFLENRTRSLNISTLRKKGGVEHAGRHEAFQEGDYSYKAARFFLKPNTTNTLQDTIFKIGVIAKLFSAEHRSNLAVAIIETPPLVIVGLFCLVPVDAVQTEATDTGKAHVNLFLRMKRKDQL